MCLSINTRSLLLAHHPHLNVFLLLLLPILLHPNSVLQSRDMRAGEFIKQSRFEPCPCALAEVPPTETPHKEGREEEISENKLRGSSKRCGDRYWCATEQACPRCKRFARLYAFYEGHVARDGRNYTS